MFKAKMDAEQVFLEHLDAHDYISLSTINILMDNPHFTIDVLEQLNEQSECTVDVLSPFEVRAYLFRKDERLLKRAPITQPLLDWFSRVKLVSDYYADR